RSHMPHLIDVLNELTEEQQALAWRRAKRAFQDCVVDYESDEFIEEFEEAVAKIAMQEDLESLERQGCVEITGICENGEYSYKITAKGEQICQQALETVQPAD